MESKNEELRKEERLKTRKNWEGRDEIKKCYECVPVRKKESRNLKRNRKKGGIKKKRKEERAEGGKDQHILNCSQNMVVQIAVSRTLTVQSVHCRLTLSAWCQQNGGRGNLEAEFMNVQFR